MKANLGLGGNLGDPPSAMAAALRQIDEMPVCQVVNVSRLYKTPPWGNTDQNWFFNATAVIETDLEPEALLDLCLTIEHGMKRVRSERWGPRTIDLDVLTYGDMQIATSRLTVPHPHMHERAFVLKPLSDYAPNLIIAGRAVQEWLSEADASGIEPVGANVNWWK